MPVLTSNKTYTWPIKKGFAITQRFGDNPNNGVNPRGGHTGYDFATPVGTELYAPGDGTVVFEGWAYNVPGGVNNQWLLAPNAAGICTIIDHGPGEPLSIIGHEMTSVTNVGDWVTRGQLIGTSDTTGLATGPHVHFEMMPDGWDINNGCYGRVDAAIFCQKYTDEIVISPQGSTTLKANERITVTPNGVNRRQGADKNTPLIDYFGPDLIITLAGYVKGTDPYGDGNNIWFVGGISGGYMHSSGFTNTSTDGLTDLTVYNPPENPSTNAPVYDFTLDFAVINGITVEKRPAETGNVDVSNFPADPTECVKHWWNNIANRPDIESVMNEFARKDAFKSAHFVVGEYRIIQMVSLKDRAYHAGAAGNDKVGIEIDPFVTEKNADGTYTDRAKRIQENVKELHQTLEEKYGHELKARLHKELMNTECSGIDLLSVEPDRSTPPVTNVPDIPAENKDTIGEFFDWLELQYKNRVKL